MIARRCPHANVVDCPLYTAMHKAGAPSCDDGDLFEGCAVAKGTLDYAGAIARLRIAEPLLVAHVEWHVEERARAAQRARNMRLAGVH